MCELHILFLLWSMCPWSHQKLMAHHLGFTQL